MSLLQQGVFALVLLSSACAEAEVRVIDGDTLDVDGTRHRLFGIDAAEREQRCHDAEGVEWNCAARAEAALQVLVSIGQVACREVPGTRDAYGRQISRCRVGDVDVADALVRQGLAWAFRRYSSDYVSAEAQARRRGEGIWAVDPGGKVNQPPWAWRKARSER